MADLSELQQTLPVKLAGADISGLETNFVNADSSGNLFTINPSDGPVTPGTVALKSSLAGGQFNTAFPTLTNGQQSAIQLDSSARQIIAPLTNSSIVKAQLQDNAGTAITVGQKPMSTSVPVVLASDQTGIPVKLSDASGNNVLLGQKAMASSLPVVISSDQSAIPVLFTNVDTAPATQNVTTLDLVTTSLVGANGQTFYVGTPTTNSAAVFPLASINCVAVQANLLAVTGTLVVEVSMDGGTFWLRPNVFQISTQSHTNGFTAPFIAIVNTAGMTHLRVRSITSWTGTATIIVKESINERPVTIADALPAGANVIGGVTQSGTWTVTAAEDKNYGAVGATTLRVAAQIGNSTGAADFNAGATGAQTLRTNANQGLPSTVANAWPTKITDGTDTVEVKPASTAAVAADPALVVSLSPNSPLPVGTNAIGTVKAQLQDNAGAAITLGQKTSANSVPVVFPSDQTITITASPLPPSGSGFTYGQVATSAVTTVPVEATTYTEQTANSTMSIASSSANDTAAGTGARTVTITYFDATMAGPLTHTATLNGTAFVNLVAGMCYIEKIIVATVGSTGSNVGTLTLKATTAGGGATVGTVAATQNRTHWAHHYVPTGKTCYISGFNNGTSGNSTGQAGLFVLRSSTPTVANTPEIQISDFQDVAGAVTNYTRLYNSPIQVPGPARIRAYVTPNATSAYSSYSSFDYIDN